MVNGGIELIEKEKIVEKWSLNEWWNRINKVEDIIAEITETKQASRDINQVLIFNYGRAALSLKEMLTLLMHGCPDGALAIARTVYEIMILTKFIYHKYEEDNNTDLIERYFDDHNVKAYESLIKLHEWIYANDASLENVKNMLDNLKREKNTLRKRYGKINSQYWWAGKEFDKRVSFKIIDEAVNDEIFMRILYERACIGIHASAMGASALLGRKNELGNVIYTTSTEYGFEVPLLLGMVSHDMIVEILCKHWCLDIEDLLSDVNNLYEEYTVKCLYNT